jgi:hypothetical protein
MDDEHGFKEYYDKISTHFDKELFYGIEEAGLFDQTKS